MKKITIYTDGSCIGNPGFGGWAAVLSYKNTQKELFGAEENTTNNRMELTAAIEALGALKESCQIDLFSDSAYMCRAFSENWLQNWEKNGWRTSGKKSVENIDLWQKLSSLNTKHKINFIKVKGHADNELNNKCDSLANKAARDLKAKNTDNAQI